MTSLVGMLLANTVAGSELSPCVWVFPFEYFLEHFEVTNETIFFVLNFNSKIRFRNSLLAKDGCHNLNPNPKLSMNINYILELIFRKLKLN